MCNIRVEDMVINMKYPVQRFRFVTTQYDRNVVADLMNGDSLFLPNYINMDYGVLQALNSKPHSLYYYGKQKTQGNQREYRHVEIYPATHYL